MATVAPQNVRRVGLLLCMGVSGLLVAHAINAFVADTLYVIPGRAAGSGNSPSAGTPLIASYSPTQAIEQIRSSGLFLLPQTPENGSTGGSSVTRPGREASLDRHSPR